MRGNLLVTLWAVLILALGVARVQAQVAAPDDAYGGQAPEGYQVAAGQYPTYGGQMSTGGQIPGGPAYSQGAQYANPGYGQQYPNPQDGTMQSADNGRDVASDQQHGVARLSIAQGDVNVRVGSTGELVAAAVNAPLISQDHVQTGSGSRAEVELDFANLIRIAPNTDLGLANVAYRRYQFQLGAGSIECRVLRDSDAQIEIDTPSIAVRPNGRGEYRISVLDDGTTQVTIRSGHADILSPRGSQRLEAGQSTLVRGNPGDPEFQSYGLPAPDQFDEWCQSRDQELLNAQSYRYVSQEIPGAEDLDAYGSWVPSEYGQVWEPRVPSQDWSPYSNGQWTWVDYYGWTWVDYSPWGWAPYHYGRWLWNGGYGWCWWPGARGASYFWSPALVGFFGWGGGAGGWGGLGWVALAPFEGFHAWWGHGIYARDRFGFGIGAGYGGRQNIAGVFRNARFRGGAMTAGYGAFGGGSHERFSPATRVQLSGGSVFRSGLPVAPGRSSFQFSNRGAVANPRLSGAANRSFFHAGQAPGQSAGQGYAGQGFGGYRSNPAGGAGHGVAPNMQGGGNRGGYSGSYVGSGAPASGWQRFGAPAGGYRQSAGPESSGWHHFGQPLSAQPSSQPSAQSGAQRYAQPNAQPSAQPRPASPGYGGYNNGYGGGRSASTAPSYSAPAGQHYSAPEARQYSAPAPQYRTSPGQHYSAPAAPHYSAPAQHYSAPAQHSGGFSHGGGSGGGSSHGGGGHSSGGHHGR